MDTGTLAKQITDYDKNKVDSNTAFNDAMAQYGVPELRKTVGGLRTTITNTANSLNAVDPSVTGRTQGSLVTEAQRQRQVVNERAPIAEQLQGQGQMLSDQERVLGEANQQATTFAQNKVNDYNAGRQALQSQFDIANTRETAAAQAARQQQDFALQQQNSQRQQQNDDRNYQLATENQRFSQSQAGNKAPSAAETKTGVLSYVAQTLKASSGTDGYVSTKTFGNMLTDFQAVGGTTRDFWKQYGRYVNKDTKARYPGYNQR